MTQWDDPSAHEGDYPPDWDVRRRAVYERDDWTCTRCGYQSGPHAGDEALPLHAHHSVPRAAGGSNRLSNLTTLCEDCHADVHGRDGFDSDRRRASPPGTGKGLRLRTRLLIGVCTPIIGGIVYLWAIDQLLTLTRTWETGVAIGVVLGILIVSYARPKHLIVSSGGIGLLFAGLAYKAVGISLLQAAIVLAVLWVPGAVAGVGMLLASRMQANIFVLVEDVVESLSHR